MKKIIFIFLLFTGVLFSQRPATLPVLKGEIWVEQANPPLSPTDNQVYLDTDGFFYKYNGATWEVTDNNDYVTSAVLAGSTLTLSIPNQSNVQVSLASLLDNTDNQTVTNFSLLGTTLSLTLEDGNTVTLDIGSILSDKANISDLNYVIVSSGNVDDVNTALLSSGTRPVYVTENLTAVDVPMVVDGNQTLIFAEGVTIGVSNSFVGDAVIINKDNDGTDKNITILGGIIDGTGATTVIYDAVRLDSVTGGKIIETIAKSVEITASGTATGNFRLIKSDSTLIKDVESYNTWRTGIYITDGVANTIEGGFFNGTHDSGIAVVDSPDLVLRDAVVDSCGTSDASNVTINMIDALVDNLTSINASGVNNGNGITVGHSGYPADSGRIVNSTFTGNTKGIHFQGAGTWNILVSNNTIYNNTTGIRMLAGVSNITVTDNILANTADFSLVAGLTDISIYGNKRFNRKNFDIYSSTATTTSNLFSDAALSFDRLEQGINSFVSISMPTSLTNLYGITANTEILTGGTDFEYTIRAHKGTESGVKLLTIDDVGAATFASSVAANSFSGDGSALTGLTEGQISDLAHTAVADGTETIVTAGTNVTVTGNGSVGTPYVINSTASGDLATADIDTFTELNTIVADATLSKSGDNISTFTNDSGFITTQTDDQIATEVAFTPFSTIAATDVQNAIEEVFNEAAGGTDDQTAAEVPITDAGANYTATDVEAALAEVQTKLNAKLDDSQLIDDDTFATATASNVPSAESVKAYHDANSSSASTLFPPKFIDATTHTLTRAEKDSFLIFKQNTDISLPASGDVNGDTYTMKVDSAGIYASFIDSTFASQSTKGFFRTVDDTKPMSITYDSSRGQYIQTGGELYVYSSGGTITQEVAASADDAKEVIATGAVNTIATTHLSPAGEYYAIRIVPSISIPAGATITDASIQLTGRYNSSGTPANILIRGQKGSNPAQFVAGTNSNISSRTQTTAEIAWSNIPAWVSDLRNADTQTPDFSTVVQEIVDDPGYTTGDAIVIILDSDANANQRRFDTFDFTTGIPELTITWTVP